MTYCYFCDLSIADCLISAADGGFKLRHNVNLNVQVYVMTVSWSPRIVLSIYSEAA
ncbi:hypothetical protein DFR28_101559 [Arenicella xantha]|uniref:Uncharacterized protein n=1 Tax=Arenicella xantha TaxID=644221 RepID=A0A395JND0_9GAMM|nr:hypothetical protein DFR28_101559 [Arenicella xantha]